MLAQLKQTNQIEIIDESAEDDAAIDAAIRYDNMLDDLGVLACQIQKFLELHRQGNENAVPLYADVQKNIKGMAIEFGIQKDMWERQDRQLQQSGLKTLIVAA